MRKKKLLNLSAILLGAIMCFSFNKVEASDSIFNKFNFTRDNLSTMVQENTLGRAADRTLEISKRRQSGNYYQWNMNTAGEGKTVWKIATSTGSNVRDYKDLYYCLNATRGFGISNGEMAEGYKDIYKNEYEMNQANKNKISDNAGGNLGKNYNKILWILDNSYIPTKNSSYVKSVEYINLMNKANIIIDDEVGLNLTEDDIEVVQQMAVWYFTNSDNSNYNKSNLPSLYVNGEQLSSKYFYTTEDGEQITGAKRQEKANKLYKYFIENAKGDYVSVEPTLNLSNEGAEVEENGNYFIVGPFKLTGTNTEKIKEIIPTVNKSYTLLDSSKNEVKDKDFNKVIGDKGFYLKVHKDDITSEDEITLNIAYKYDFKKLIFITDENDPTNTQPVVIVKVEEIEKNISTKIELTSVNVEKKWNDENNQDGLRPKEVKVQLYVNGKAEGKSVTLNNSNNWSYEWKGLLKNKTYTIKELNSNGNAVEDGSKYNDNYNAKYEINGNKTTIINTHIPEVIEKTVTKIWNDNGNQDGTRPNSIQVQLYANGQPKGEPVTIFENNGEWKYTWTNLPKYSEGKEIVYTVVEKQVDGYTTEYSDDTFTITNSYTPGKVSKTVIKDWQDGEDADEIRPEEITVILYKIVNGEEIEIDRQKLNESNNWTYTWSELNEKENGENIVYTVKEETVNGYETVYSAEDYKDTNIITITNTHTPEIKKEFDLALRKFITQINDKMYTREPVVNTDTIATTGTATYKHTKEPIAVQVGDIVNYTIRVYNEGETDGYASEITDYLPEWLDFLPDDEVNTKYLWQQDIENNRKITTNITSKDSASGEELYGNRENKQLLSAYNGGDTLDYIDVQIRCRVNEKAQIKQLITNIAEISQMQDNEGTEVITDRDSTKANVNLPTDENLPNYKGKESNKDDLTDKDYYYKGQEDDDDFEKVVVENFDLSLRKFITALNDTEFKNEDGTYVREPVVDTSKLGTKDENGNVITTAIYNHPKTPVQVAKGDIVTYCIRVYNEGTLAGYANQVIDNIPEGLEFIEDSSINKSNGWELKDGKIVTTYLSDENINNVINPVSEDAEGNKVLSYKDVKVQFKVVAEPSKFMGELITNWAEIKEDSNNDIDSVPGNDVKEEDDIDFEPVKLVYFDLSLRKFITNVNEIEYNNRVPEVDTSKMGTTDENGNKITTATYTHTKDPVVLETGNIVTYTIRVYNEGTLAGYASEITDNIPEGLEFLPENETNTNYKWIMLDEKGEITQDVNKAKKITTNYLSEANGKDNILSGYQEENGAISLDYKDVKVAFKVVEPNTSDRIVVNTAEISKASDEDIDSVPGNNVEGEDDIDKEYVRVETFDLALKKWVTATKVTYNGKTVTKKTGFDENSTEMAKVDLIASQLKKTTVKFVYCIKVTNEGQVAGYATEIKDYVPSGLKFVKEDNPDWTLQKDGTVTTDKLKDTLLQPGQSATVEITFTWKNSSTNMGVKTNWAEISADSGDDIDSTPNNNNKLEDDIDDAKVILSIKTGSVKMYIILSLISIAILGGGTFAIRKYVINK